MEIKQILIKNNFRFNKALGQNFITDVNLLSAIVADSGVCAEDTVVEIGTGAGTLTRAIAAVAKKVISFELDEKLQPVLAETLVGVENVEVIFRDVLRMSDEGIAALCGRGFKVIANLPYYVTTPMIMRFLNSDLDVADITVMVQKEVAERLVATSGSSEYSAITASVALVADTAIKRIVSRALFYPRPDVDSAVIKISPRVKFSKDEVENAQKLIKLGFLMRRKTLYNNLNNYFDSEKIMSALSDIGFEQNVRGERLSAADYIKLAKLLY